MWLNNTIQKHDTDAAATPNKSWRHYAPAASAMGERCTRQGKIVLVQLRHAIDPDNGERYTVKRSQSEKGTDGDSWRHTRITLKPINPDFQPIELTGSEEGELQVVAELVEVLGDAL